MVQIALYTERLESMVERVDARGLIDASLAHRSQAQASRAVEICDKRGSSRRAYLQHILNTGQTNNNKHTVSASTFEIIPRESENRRATPEEGQNVKCKVESNEIVHIRTDCK